MSTRAAKSSTNSDGVDRYKVICISIYKSDLARLDEKVKLLKGRGHTKANRSALIRHALDALDLNQVPR